MGLWPCSNSARKQVLDKQLYTKWAMPAALTALSVARAHNKEKEHYRKVTLLSEHI